MIICKVCGRKTNRGESTGKFRTMAKVEYLNGTIGNRIVKEDICCIGSSGEEYVDNIELEKQAEYN
jgi:hypothetical protein